MEKRPIDGKKGLAVEFYGMPGVGKSSLASCACELLAAHGCCVSREMLDLEMCSLPRRVTGKARSMGWLLQHDVSLLTKIVGFVRSTLRRHAQGSFRALTNWVYVAGALGRGTAQTTETVAGQGLAQALWSTLLRGGEPTDADRGVKLIGDIAERLRLEKLLVVYVTADREVIWDRLAVRRGGRSPRSLQDDYGAFRKACTMTMQLGDALETSAKVHSIVRLIRVDNSGDLCTAAAELGRALQPHCLTRGASRRPQAG